jgi:hypothetical protein
MAKNTKPLIIPKIEVVKNVLDAGNFFDSEEFNTAKK